MRALVVMVLLGAGCVHHHSRGGGVCSKAFPHGVGARTVTVFLAVELRPQNGMAYNNPATLSENLATVFTTAVQQAAASNPGGTQVVFTKGHVDVDLTVVVYASGRGETADQAWVQLEPYGLGAHGWLFRFTGPAFTMNAGVPEDTAVSDAGQTFYNYLSQGWNCDAQ